uniref:Pyridoxal phosphate homeostasis protein n=2 Tax=Schistocephalus solidus TaxID=70667 RepID=A0A0X3P2Q5_SCHSO
MMVSISKNLSGILARMEAAYSKVTNPEQRFPTLVAVSKTKPSEAVIEAYECGQRIFGENYVQELYKKSTDEKLLAQCPDIQWHFIGRLQSNKVKLLLSVPNLSIVETVSSLQMATLINKEWAKHSSNLLDILLQVNTSGEEQKGGVLASKVVELYKSISESCDRLRVRGLMTIGKYGYDPSLGPNPDFVSLVTCRDSLCRALGLPQTEVELSMGMSTDFEQAIELGSQFVRVGSSVFGCRQ